MRPKRKDKHTKRVPQSQESEKAGQSKEKNLKSDDLKTDTEPQNSTDEEDAQPSYKREINSNWERYEEDVEITKSRHDEGQQKLRGADFAELLATTGEMPQSRFRFQDEKDWDEIPDNVFNAMLSLDCTDLAKSLKCIPIPKLLDIPKETFTLEQQKKFLDAAKSHSAVYKSQMTQPRPVLKALEKAHPVLRPTKEITSATQEIHEITPEIENSETANTPIETSTPAEEQLEDELDQLLALGTSKNFEKPVTNTLPDIDKILPSTSPLVSPARTVPTQINRTETSLEDWLDDFLQD